MHFRSQNRFPVFGGEGCRFPAGRPRPAGMTTITHTAVGGMIGGLGFGSPVSFLLGVASHLPLDLVPHWDIKRVWIDTVLTIGCLLFLLVLFGSSPIFWGAAGGALPDLEHLVFRGKKLFPGHGGAHGRTLSIAHAWWQLLILAAFCVWLGVAWVR